MSATFNQLAPSGEHADAALRIVNRLLQGFAGGANLRLWNETSHPVGPAGIHPGKHGACSNSGLCGVALGHFDLRPVIRQT